jgi:hypothetical protein
VLYGIELLGKTPRVDNLFKVAVRPYRSPKVSNTAKISTYILSRVRTGRRREECQAQTFVREAFTRDTADQQSDLIRKFWRGAHIAAKRSAHDVANISHAQTCTAGMYSA